MLSFAKSFLGALKVPNMLCRRQVRGRRGRGSLLSLPRCWPCPSCGFCHCARRCVLVSCQVGKIDPRKSFHLRISADPANLFHLVTFTDTPDSSVRPSRVQLLRAGYIFLWSGRDLSIWGVLRAISLKVVKISDRWHGESAVMPHNS